jgi:hypothetical protein
VLQVHNRTAVPAAAALLGSSMHTVALFRGRSRCSESTSQRWLSLLPQVARRTGQLLAVQLSAARHSDGLLLCTRIWLSNVQRWLTAARAPAVARVGERLCLPMCTPRRGHCSCACTAEYHREHRQASCMPVSRKPRCLHQNGMWVRAQGQLPAATGPGRLSGCALTSCVAVQNHHVSTSYQGPCRHIQAQCAIQHRPHGGAGPTDVRRGRCSRQ